MLCSNTARTFSALRQFAHARCVRTQDKGVITAAEHAAFAYPIDFRDLDSLMVPFKPSVDKDGKTVGRR